MHKSTEDYIQFYNHDGFIKKLNQFAPVEYRHILAEAFYICLLQGKTTFL
ncbi:IS3 family transposase [Bacillus sp. FSL M8-0077]